MGRRRKRVLLIEPAYGNKYPPLGLMKIATAHKLQGDEICFHRGTSVKLRDQRWDTIYIATLFTFQWLGAVETIRFYARGKNPVVVGGILATLMPEEIEKVTGIRPQVGPFRGDIESFIGSVSKDDDLARLNPDLSSNGIDLLPPDYGVFDGATVPYHECLKEYYILTATKGCCRGCKFCAVKDLQPRLIERIRLEPYISYINKRWGEKRNLLLLDDNVLLSPKFNQIVDEICQLGFEKGAKSGRKRKVVDFNQGLDVRLISRKHIKKLSTIELRPLRLAFDDITLRETYRRKVEWCLEAGFTEISSYVLYNFQDSPADIYHRLRISCELNARHGCRIYSFPMKYIPCDSKDRKHISSRWTRRQIRGLQCILNATHGIAPTDPDFFRVAFGENVREFQQILQMPENYIIERSKHAGNGVIRQWKNSYESMSPYERRLIKKLIAGGKGTINGHAKSMKIEQFLTHYLNENIQSKSN